VILYARAAAEAASTAILSHWSASWQKNSDFAFALPLRLTLSATWVAA
jgi:hypothetical protein